MPTTYTRTILALCLSKVLAAGLEVAPSHADGIYKTGDSITWSVVAPTDIEAPLQDIGYRVMRDAGQVLQLGALVFKNGRGQVECLADKPGTLLLEFDSKEEKSAKKVIGGAFVEPDKIPRSAPRPTDFDAFWNGKLAELARVPMNPDLTAVKNDINGVSRWHVTLDMPNGAKMRGQLARPENGGKFPAIIVFQWAGVYGLESWSVNNHAANGWLAMNVMAHDLPIAQAADFYKVQDAGPLKNYPMIGCEDREKSYFLRMFLACSRAVDYLASRPDWDGRTIVVTGASQGGLQSIVAAALNPKVTEVMVIVPAGCDATASQADRSSPWPYWGKWMPGEKQEQALHTAPYYDAINFAPRVKCRALVGFGLLDQTATPASVSQMTRQLGGPVEQLMLVSADHKGDHGAYQTRAKEWLAALKPTNPADPITQPIDPAGPHHLPTNPPARQAAPN